MARLEGTWTEPRRPETGLPAPATPVAAAITAAAAYTGPRAMLLAIAGVFAAIARAPAEPRRLACASDSMGGLDCDLELAGGGCALSFRLVQQLSDSWQRVETERNEFSFSGPAGLTWELEALPDAPAGLRLAIDGLDEAQADAAAAVLVACFAEHAGSLGGEDVEREIRRLEGGGYNADHEWEADHPMYERIDGCAALLGRWADLAPAGRERLLGYARKLAAEDAPWPGSMAGRLLAHRSKPAVAELILSLLESAPFARDLLTAARDGGVALPEPWAAAIRTRVHNQGFADPGSGTNRKRLYREIAGLLNAVAP